MDEPRSEAWACTGKAIALALLAADCTDPKDREQANAIRIEIESAFHHDLDQHDTAIVTGLAELIVAMVDVARQLSDQTASELLTLLATKTIQRAGEVE